MGGVTGQNVYEWAGRFTPKLIQAVVECAYNVGAPPPELTLAWQCQRWNCLPDRGAYLDQDYILIRRMTAFSSIYNVLQRWQQASGKNIHNISESDRNMLKWLKDKGMIFN